MSKPEVEAAICDANILIDFVAVDEDVIREMVSYWGKVNVPDMVLFEVKNLTDDRAKELGLTIIETPLELPANPGLSYQDRACLHFVQEKDWICLTNDGALRKECINSGGMVIRGLRILLLLTENQMITPARARDIARKIHDINLEITAKLLKEFEKLLDAIEKASQGNQEAH